MLFLSPVSTFFSFVPPVSGYRHVYLEGIEEASIFVHVAINDICGKVSPFCSLCVTDRVWCRIREAQWVRKMQEKYLGAISKST